jgi:transcriptional regulator with XRE-family HTH domain
VKEDTAMELGKKIVEQRKKAHLTQEELASQLYVSRQTLSRWESDVNQPDVESLAKMAAHLPCLNGLLPDGGDLA